jgi:hypothetical protein
MVGGTFKEGTVVFSVSIKSTDESKVQALVAEIRRNREDIVVGQPCDGLLHQL